MDPGARGPRFDTRLRGHDATPVAGDRDRLLSLPRPAARLPAPRSPPIRTPRGRDGRHRRRQRERRRHGRRRCARAFPRFASSSCTRTSASPRPTTSRCARRRADQVLLLNPDTEIWPGVLDAMSTFLRAHPRAGVAGCRLVRRDGSFDHAAKRSIPTVADALRYFAPGRAWQRLSRAGGRPRTRSARSMPSTARSCSCAARRCEQVGLLDDGYWMYGEDLDWCTRFRRAGWDVLYNGRGDHAARQGRRRRGPTAAAPERRLSSVDGPLLSPPLGGERARWTARSMPGIGAKLGLSICHSLLARAAGRVRARTPG